jgi:hypothetical protein
MRNGFVYLLILLAIGAILYSYRSQSTRPDSKTITEVAAALKANNQRRAQLDSVTAEEARSLPADDHFSG